MNHVYKFQVPISSNYAGIKQLLDFYEFCKDFTNESIAVDFYHCDFFEANLCAILDALMFILEKENKLKFSTDFEFIKEKFDVFFRNGFIKDEQSKVEDFQGTTLPFETFTYTNYEKNRFCSYVEEKLMVHKGIPNLEDSLKEIIIEDLIEIYSNSAFHADSTDPFFVSGQYYPKNKELKFTMVDLGQGFLPKINLATNGKITTDIKAIVWATENSSKMATDSVPGGLGINRILNYCKQNKGTLTIISGNGYWSSELENTYFKEGREHNSCFNGAIIILTFRK